MNKEIKATITIITEEGDIHSHVKYALDTEESIKYSVRKMTIEKNISDEDAVYQRKKGGSIFVKWLK